MVAFLAAAGLILVFLEFFLPGAIMAIGGGLLLLASLILFYIEETSLLSLAVYAAGLALALFLVIRLALSRVQKGQVCLPTDQEGFQACVYPKEMIGKVAIATTDLKPSGYIQAGDSAFAALSKSGYIEKGAQVRIIGGEGASLIVAQEIHQHVSNASH